MILNQTRETLTRAIYEKKTWLYIFIFSANQARAFVRRSSDWAFFTHARDRFPAKGGGLFLFLLIDRSTLTAADNHRTNTEI